MMTEPHSIDRTLYSNRQTWGSESIELRGATTAKISN